MLRSLAFYHGANVSFLHHGVSQEVQPHKLWSSYDQKNSPHGMNQTNACLIMCSVYQLIEPCIMSFNSYRKTNWKQSKSWMKWRRSCKQPQKKLKLVKRRKGRSRLEKSSDCVFLTGNFLLYFCRKPIFTPGRREPGTPRHTPRRIGL